MVKILAQETRPTEHLVWNIVRSSTFFREPSYTGLHAESYPETSANRDSSSVRGADPLPRRILPLEVFRCRQVFNGPRLAIHNRRFGDRHFAFWAESFLLR